MQPPEPELPPPSAGLPLLAAADLQDNLMVANHDLERLQRLLGDASDTLMSHFLDASQHMHRALDQVAVLPAFDSSPLQGVRENLSGAVTALQFQDMATQLIAHTQRRLRNCVDRIARDTMGDDEDGTAIVEEGPLRPNPVTQDEMDAGSVDLF